MFLTGASSAVGVSNRLLDLVVHRLGEALGSPTHSRVEKGLLSTVRVTLHEPVFEREGRGGLDFWLPYSKMIPAPRSSVNGIFAF